MPEQANSGQNKDYQLASARVRRHLRKLSEKDEALAQAIDRLGYPKPRIRGAGFDVFLHTIVSQQLSVHAAEAIWRRLEKHFVVLEPKKILRCREQTLRKLGLSERKAEYCKSVARAFLDGSICPENLAQQSDSEVIERITAVKGFGRWSAEIYLMFSLQRNDIFAADDLALQIGLQKLKGLDQKPTAKEAREMVAHWRPFRSAGSLFLWHFYSQTKSQKN